MIEVLPTAAPMAAMTSLGDDVPVIVVTSFDIESLASINETSDDSVPVIVLSSNLLGHGSDGEARDLFAASGRLCALVTTPVPSGMGQLRAASVIAGPRDVVVTARCRALPEGWLDALAEAAHGDEKTASASPFCQCDELFGVGPDVPESVYVIGPAEHVRAPLHGSHCVFWRRSALDLLWSIGDPALAVKSPARWVTDFGLHHVAATRLVVRCHPGLRSEREVDEYTSRFIDDTRTPLANARSRVQLRHRPMRVLLDARALSGPVSGTSILTAAVGRALMARPDDLQVTWWQPIPASDAMVERLRGLGISSVRNITTERFDVVFRPHQLQGHYELETLLSAGDRLVVLVLDTIAFENRSYFPSVAAWAKNREATALAAFCADHLCFLSNAALRDAVAEGLVEEGKRATVIGCGIDPIHRDYGRATPRLMDLRRPYVLSLGASFLHKNRPVAIRTFAQLIATGWPGSLVLAGPCPIDGSSAEIERRLLEEWPDVAARTSDLGPVTDTEKSWLLCNADLVLSLASSEGFGLVPFEAASVGTPSLSLRSGALPELLPHWPGYLDSLQPALVSQRVRETLDSETRIQELVDPIAAAAETLTWEAVAKNLQDVFDDVLMSPRTRKAGFFPGALGVRGPDEAVVAVPRPAASDLAAVFDALERRPRLAAAAAAAYRSARDLKLAWRTR